MGTDRGYMMDDNHFLRPKQPLGNYQTAERFAGSAACVADDVCVAFGEAEDGEDVDARVHAGDDGQFALGREREMAFCESGGVLRVGGFDVCYVGHVDCCRCMPAG